MIVHNGKSWKTLDDKIYHKGKQITKIYQGYSQYYPHDNSIFRVIASNGTLNCEIYGENVEIDFGDGTVVRPVIPRYQHINITHSFDSNEYIVSFSGGLYFISLANSDGLIRVLTPLVYNETPYILPQFQLPTFKNCKNLLSIPSNLFIMYSHLKVFLNMFNGCSKLETIPSGLFDNCTMATRFDNCFSGCSRIENIPSGLFDKCERAKVFSGCFANCESLKNIPGDIFQNCIKADSFNSTFQNCIGLTNIPDDLFSKISYSQMSVSFTKCFSGCTSIRSNVPVLWRKQSAYGVYGGECYRGCTNAKNYEEIPPAWK